MTAAISDPIASLAAQSSAAQSASTKSSNQLDQNAFMQLMITQFKNQNPMQPQDPGQMLTQLAQFSTVTGIQGMQASISSLSDSLKSSHVLDGASLVGHYVLAPQSNIAVGSDHTIGGAIDVPTGATSLSVAIRDSSGQLVRQMSLQPQAGLNNFSWDGVQDNGTTAAPGNYSVSAIGSVAGQNQSLPTLLLSRVGSVTIDPTSQSLTLNTDSMGAVALANVRQVM